MLRYITLYLSWFVFYLEWKSVRLELLTSIYILCTLLRVLVVSYRKEYCKSLYNMSLTVPIADWLEGHAGKQRVTGWIPGGGIH